MTRDLSDQDVVDLARTDPHSSVVLLFKARGTQGRVTMTATAFNTLVSASLAFIGSCEAGIDRRTNIPAVVIDNDHFYYWELSRVTLSTGDYLPCW
jgi:hypothetical protein